MRGNNRIWTMQHAMRSAFVSLLLLTGCGAAGGDRTVVERVGSDDLPKLRAGPGLGFGVLLGLPDGTEPIRRDCESELGQLWCRVLLAEAPGITGYVSADCLSET